MISHQIWFWAYPCKRRLRRPVSLAYAQTLETTTGIQVFGTPTGSILRMLQQQAGSGIPLSINPLHLGGVTRAREG